MLYNYHTNITGIRNCSIIVMATGVCKCRRSLKYGTILLGAMAALTGAVFTTHFRQRMLLRTRAKMASYVPTMVIPFLTTTTAQDMFSYRRLLGEKPQCQLCTDVNVVSAQVHVF